MGIIGMIRSWHNPYLLQASGVVIKPIYHATRMCAMHFGILQNFGFDKKESKKRKKEVRKMRLELTRLWLRPLKAAWLPITPPGH